MDQMTTRMVPVDEVNDVFDCLFEGRQPPEKDSEDDCTIRQTIIQILELLPAPAASPPA